MLWRIPVDTLEKRIDAMHAAQLSLDAPPPATRVSASNVFHRPKRAALTALTRGMGGPSGTATGVAVAEIAEIARTGSALDRQLARHQRRNAFPRSTMGRPTAKSLRSCPRCVPAKTKGSAISGQPLDFIGGAKRDRPVDLYNAIVALSQLSYGPETSGTARDIIPAPLTGNRGTGNSGLAVAFALVVLDLDALDLDVLGVVGKLVRLLQGLVALDIGKLVAGQRRLVALLLGRRFCRGQCGGCRRRCRGRRRGRAARAADLHEVLTIMIAPALRALDRAFVQVVEARAAALAGALSTPVRLDHAGTPGKSAKIGRMGREGGRMSRVFHPVKTKFRHATRTPCRISAVLRGVCPV